MSWSRILELETQKISSEFRWRSAKKRAQREGNVIGACPSWISAFIKLGIVTHEIISPSPSFSKGLQWLTGDVLLRSEFQVWFCQLPEKPGTKNRWKISSSRLLFLPCFNQKCSPCLLIVAKKYWSKEFPRCPIARFIFERIYWSSPCLCCIPQHQQ